ncbi:unnamed protein product, partial [Heterosigma akashiwo]
GRPAARGGRRGPPAAAEGLRALPPLLPAGGRARGQAPRLPGGPAGYPRLRGLPLQAGQPGRRAGHGGAGLLGRAGGGAGGGHGAPAADGLGRRLGRAAPGGAAG